MIDYKDLTYLDMELLQIVSEAPNQQISLEKLTKTFSDPASAEVRVELLSQPMHQRYFNGHLSVPVRNTSYLYYHQSEHLIEISALGLKTISDWQYEQKQAKRKRWEERVWEFLPIAISLFALLVAIISLLQSLKWIDISKAGIL